MRSLAPAVALALIAVASPVGAQNGIDLRADAGLGGLGRLGRWTPVRITIANDAVDLAGDIVVEWGDTRLHRTIDAPAPSKTVVELYVRTIDVRDSIAVRLLSGDRAIAAATVPIRMVDGPLVVCAGDAAQSASGGVCTTTIAADAFPDSMRGWDAADDVHVQPGVEARLDPRKRSALRRWRDYHDLEAEGILQFVPRASWNGQPRPGRRAETMLASAAAVAPLVVCAWVWIRARGAAMRSYTTLGSAIVVGVLGSAMVGRAGPGAAVIVRQATTVYQVGDGAVVSMRGAITYPALDRYAIRVQGIDGALVRRGSDNTQAWLDATGVPERRGTFGRGAAEDVELDAVIDYTPFSVIEDGGAVRVSNQSDRALTDCLFPEGFSRRDAGTLAPGASVEARATGPVDVPFFSCALADSPLSFSDAGFPVLTEGSTIVSVRLPAVLRPEAAQ